MQHITTTALAAGAREVCAVPTAPALPGMGSISTQPAFRPVLRRDIMAAVNTCGRMLGLGPSSVVTLDALLSCLPCKNANGREVPVTPTTLLTVYASNETLCYRAKGMTERQLRRHFDILERAGLIRRRDSANGKRFPVMRNGRPVGAFGLDLSPLFARADELLALALRCREQAAELRGLRAQILHLRAACADLRLDDKIAAWIDNLRNLVRRATLTLAEARAVIIRLTAVLAGDTSEQQSYHIRAFAETEAHDAPTPPSETTRERETPPAHGAEPATLSDTPAVQMPASNGQNVRHIEPESDTKKRKREATQPVSWSELTEVSSFYPEPDSIRDATVIAFEFGRMLRISQDLLASAVHITGLWGLIQLEDRMAKQIDSIRNPNAYMRSILQI